MTSGSGVPAGSPRRLLWVTAEAPDHERGGGAIRQAHLLDGLARSGALVDLLVAGRVADPAVRGLAAGLREVPVPARRPARSVAARRVRDLWRAGFARVPAEVADRRRERAALRRELGAVRAGAARYDAVHLEHLGLAGIVPDGVAPVRSLGVQNVPSRMADQARALAPGARQRWLLGAEAAAARRFQSRAAAATEVLAVVSHDDAADLVGAAPGGPVVVVAPNGVDTRHLRAAPLPGTARLVFTGTLDYLPNVDGIVWFCREVLPLVRRGVPAAELDVVGRRPVAEVRALAALPGVTLHADVEEVAPFLTAARAAVVPVRIGTGSRLKALEAMACARPVAATTIGLEGLDVEAGRHALVADSPEALAGCVSRLLTDEALAAGVAAAGRDLVEAAYDWRGIADRFAAALWAVVDQVRADQARPDPPA